MICKRYSEIDFELYEIVSGPFYECGDCDPCYTVVSRTDLILSDYQSCYCDSATVPIQPQCYEIPNYGIVGKTHSVDIPPNPYVPSYSTKTSPSESGKLCASNSSYNQVQMSNKIKITIPYDPVFGGTYVFDRIASNNEWKLNELESITSINTCINTGDVNPIPKQLINFYEVMNPSNASECYVETYTKFIEDLFTSSGNIYAFPAKYRMCLTQPAPSIDELGHRLSVGFTLPIRYRPRCQDWVLADRLYGSNGKKTPHTIYGSPNYAYYDDPYFFFSYNLNPKFTFLNSDNSQACGSGISNLGFSFRCDGVSLGYNCQNICTYPYNGDNNETSWFTPKQPVIAQIEFVYDCRPQCACNTVLNYNEISASNWGNNTIKCYGSSVNINYDCTSQSPEPSYVGHAVEVYFVASEKYIFFIRDNINSNIYYSTPTSIGSVDKVIKYPSTFSTPGIDIVYSMIYWINNNVSVFSAINNQQPNIENNKYSAVDIYWNTTNSTYKLYILPSED